MSTNKEITIEGKTFYSIKEAAKYYNLALGTVNARLNRRQQLMGRRPVNNSPAANDSYSDSANIDAEDLEDAFGI